MVKLPRFSINIQSFLNSQTLCDPVNDTGPSQYGINVSTYAFLFNAFNVKSISCFLIITLHDVGTFQDFLFKLFKPVL